MMADADRPTQEPGLRLSLGVPLRESQGCGSHQDLLHKPAESLLIIATSFIQPVKCKLGTWDWYPAQV
jgi:hypothetical protein